MKQNEIPPTQPFYQMSNAGQFGLLLALTGCGIVLGTAAIVGILFTTSNLFFSNGSMNLSSVNPHVLRTAQVLGTFLQFALPAWIFAILLKQNPRSFYCFNKKSSAKVWLLVVALTVAGTTFGDLLAIINEQIPVSNKMYEKFISQEKLYLEQILRIVDFGSFGGGFLSLIIIAILPAFFEEVLFRGALQPVLIRWTKSAFLGIFAASLFFSLIHFSFFGLLPRLFLGMALGYVFYWGKNIWLNIAFHFLNNTIALLGYYSLHKQNKLNFHSATEHLPFGYLIAGSVVFLLAFYLFYKICTKQNKEPNAF